MPTYTVDGRVVFSDGSPARTGSVEFKSRNHGIQARGEIGSDGSFELTTYTPSDGAVAGVHDVVVVQLVMVEEVADFRPSTEGVVHPRFGSYGSSGVECEIQAADDNQITIQVHSISPGEFGSASSHDHEHGHGHDHTHTSE